MPEAIPVTVHEPVERRISLELLRGLVVAYLNQNDRLLRSYCCALVRQHDGASRECFAPPCEVSKMYVAELSEHLGNRHELINLDADLSDDQTFHSFASMYMEQQREKEQKFSKAMREVHLGGEA